MVTELDVVEIKRTLEGMAEILATYVAELRRHSFSRGEALKIAIAWQTAIITTPTSPDPPPEEP